MHPSGCSRQGGIFQELPPKLTVTLSSQLKTFPSSRFSAREISPDNAKDRVSIETTRRMENGESKPRGDCSMGDPSSDPYWKISDRMYIREGIYILYLRFGKFLKVVSKEFWTRIGFGNWFFLGRLYQRILNWKFWRIVNLKGSSFWIFIKLPSIFQGKNVSWNFWIEVCRTVLKVIPRIARDWNCSEEYFRSYYPILCIEKFLDRYLVNNFFFDIVS